MQALFPQPRHDHGRCVRAALSAAERLCAARRLRWTPLRRQVLTALLSDHKPRGAYALRRTLHEMGRPVAAAAVYRVLAFLVGCGLAHRLPSARAFVACRHAGGAHRAQFLVCRVCGRVGEMMDARVARAVAAAALRADFATAGEVVEVSGLCVFCRRTRDGAG